MVAPLRPSQTVPLSNIIRASYDVGRLALPLENPGMFIKFKHVVGVPGDGEGFSVMKLRLLDNLIERLVVMRRRSVEPLLAPEPSGLQAMIEGLERDLHAAVSKDSLTPYGLALGAGAAEDGRLLNSFV